MTYPKSNSPSYSFTQHFLRLGSYHRIAIKTGTGGTFMHLWPVDDDEGKLTVRFLLSPDGTIDDATQQTAHVMPFSDFVDAIKGLKSLRML